MVMKTDVRVPKQARSIEKKNKILEASYALFSEVGYFGTNTAEIAKRAGVSTGIVYGYFHDKRDILICILDDYINSVASPVFAVFENATELNYEVLVPAIVDTAIVAHKNNSKIHEVLHSLTATDDKVREAFIGQEDTITEKFAEKLQALGESKDGLNEKVHLSMNLIQSFCHEYVFDNHHYINYDYMKTLVCNLVISLFKN